MSSVRTQPNNLWARLVSSIRNSPPMRYPDLGLICLALFVELVGVGAIVPIRTIYAREMGATMAELGLMASAFLLGGLLFQLPGGWASDRWGRKPLLVMGVAVAGVVSFLFLLNDHPWYFIMLRFIEGAAGGAIAPSANAYVMDTVPEKERGSAFGWLGSSFSAGFMMGPAIGGVLVDAFGYAAPFIFGGVTSLATALLLTFKMSNRKPGGEPLELVETTAQADVDEAKAKRHIPKQLFVPALIGALAFTVASGLGDGIFISIWTLWLNDLHASTTLIGLTFVTFSLPLMVLMPFTGKMADKFRIAPLLAIPGALISIVYLVYGVTENLLLITSIGLVEGVFIAVMIPALGTYTANLSPSTARGRLQGLMSTARTLAGFTSSMVTAILYGVNHSFPWFMLFATQITISVFGGLLVWWVERRTAKLNSTTAAPPSSERPSALPALEVAAK